MLDEKINLLIKDIKQLKNEIKDKEELLSLYLAEKKKFMAASCKYSKELSTEEIARYSRQMLVADMRLSGQIRLKHSKVLIVGAGGLGCPSAMYLACAGIGEITIIDYDDVEISNLHRQILHTEDDIGMPKVESAYDKLHSINRKIKITPLKQQVDSNSIQHLLKAVKYDVVIDGSDNVATRYLLNDACVLNGIPLVSGSALQMEAQLTVYNYKGGPCYRCLFPVPPPPETVTSCGDGGVIGPVPGMIGVLQALETIKIIVGSDGVLTGRLLLFDGTNSTFRNVKLRPRNQNCVVCGDDPSITELIDYEQFCGANAHDKVININILSDSDHVNARELPEKLGKKLILDVRPQLQFEMCHLPDTTNLPFEEIQKPNGLDRIKGLLTSAVPDNEVYILCRRGNDSQRTVCLLKDRLSHLPFTFLNIKGGLQAYSNDVDTEFPVF